MDADEVPLLASGLGSNIAAVDGVIAVAMGDKEAAVLLSKTTRAPFGGVAAVAMDALRRSRCSHQAQHTTVDGVAVVAMAAEEVVLLAPRTRRRQWCHSRCRGR